MATSRPGTATSKSGQSEKRLTALQDGDEQRPQSRPGSRGATKQIAQLQVRRMPQAQQDIKKRRIEKRKKIVKKGESERERLIHCSVT